MKLTDRDIVSILKVISATELIEKYVNRKIILSKEQLNRLIFIKNESKTEISKEEIDSKIDKYIEVLNLVKEIKSWN